MGLNVTKLNIMNWKDEITENFAVNLDIILRIDVVVERGDETMTIIYKDGYIETHSAYTARVHFYEGRYCIYLPTKKVNKIDAFMKRKNPYWFKSLLKRGAE